MLNNSRNLILLTIVTLSLLSSCSNAPETTTRSTTKARETPTDYMFLQRAFPKGKIKETARQEAISWKKDYYEKNQNFAKLGITDIGDMIGPTNAGGRIADLEIPIDQPNTYYVGAASGGVFKTEDSGVSWQPIFDEQSVLAIGDIEISKNNTDLIWVGTGEADAYRVHAGDGVFKSEDGGITWESKGLSNAATVGKVKLDPNNDDIIFVAAMGPIYRSSEDRGIYRSKDGGDNWTKVLYIDDYTGGIDIALHPSNSNIIYASMWEREFTENLSVYGGPNSGLYRSLDGGDTWEELENGLSTSNTISKIKVEIAPSNPNVVYSLYINAAGNIEGFYYSNDGGDSWEERNSEQLPSVGFNDYFGDIYVHPTDENTVYNMGFQAYKTTDGGQSWTHVFVGVHFDQQSFSFDPMTPDKLIIGNDGGLYKSNDGGVTSTKVNNIPITQFYRLYVNNNNNNIIYGGAQDNGSWRSTTTDGIDDWEKVNEGDGMQPLAATTDGSFWYSSTQSGQLYKQGYAGYVEVTPSIGVDERNNWDTPVTFDPNNTETLYYGSNKVYRTTNGADSWNVISPDLSNGPGPGSKAFGTLTTIDVSSLDSDLIYAGLDDGNIWVTENGGTDWTKISNDLPVRWVTKVYADRENSDKVYVTLSGYRYGEDNGNVYVSNDRGQNWTAIGATLPDIPINDIVKDLGEKLMIGTDVGIFLSQNEGNTWQPFGTNLPSILVTDLHIIDENNTLYAATYGRSMYKFDISSVMTSTEETSIVENNFTIAPNPAKDFTQITLPKTAQQISATIYGSFGNLITRNSYSNTQSFNLSVSELASGTYYLHIKTENAVSTKKLIII